MEKIENKAVIFALGGMSIGNAVELLGTSEDTKSIVTDTCETDSNEKKMSGRSTKHISEIIVTVIAIILLAPILIVVCTLIFASSIGSILHGKSIKVEQYDCWQLEKSSVTPGQTGTWQILPDGNEVNLDNWTKMEIQYIDNRSLKSDAGLFFKTFRTILLKRGY